MSNCNLAMNAIINEKEDPNRIYVHGSVMVYTEETTVSIARADPQGANSAVLLLSLIVTENSGPRKGISRAFFYEEQGLGVSSYAQVKVVSNEGDECTVEVEVFG